MEAVRLTITGWWPVVIVTAWIAVVVFLAALAGGYVSWKWVFRTWRFPKIIVLPKEDINALGRQLPGWRPKSRRKGKAPNPDPPEDDGGIGVKGL